MSVIAPSTSSVSPMIERTTSGVSRGAMSASSGFAPRDGRAAGGLAGRRVRRRVSPRQTSTTTGKTIGRRFVCSYRKRDSAVLDLGLEQRDLADVVARVCRSTRSTRSTGLPHDRVLLVEVDEAAGDDLRLADDRAGLLVDGDDDHEHAVVGEGSPVAQDDVADIADRQPVDVDVAGGDRGGAPRGAVGEELDRRAVLDDEHVLRRDPGLDREAAVLDLHPELAVHRDEVLRLGQPEHELELFLAGVA